MDEAYRLTFDYDGASLSLRSRERLAMRILAGQGADTVSDLSIGHFVELRDGAGEPLYRCPISEALSPTMEYPTGDPERPFGRADVAHVKRSITVLVPVEKKAQTVAVVEVAVPEGYAITDEGGPESRDLISINLDDAREPE